MHFLNNKSKQIDRSQQECDPFDDFQIFETQIENEMKDPGTWKEWISANGDSIRNQSISIATNFPCLAGAYWWRLNRVRYLFSPSTIDDQMANRSYQKGTSQEIEAFLSGGFTIVSSTKSVENMTGRTNPHSKSGPSKNAGQDPRNTDFGANSPCEMPSVTPKMIWDYCITVAHLMEQVFVWDGPNISRKPSKTGHRVCRNSKTRGKSTFAKVKEYASEAGNLPLDNREIEELAEYMERWTRAIVQVTVANRGNLAKSATAGDMATITEAIDLTQQSIFGGATPESLTYSLFQTELNRVNEYVRINIPGNCLEWIHSDKISEGDKARFVNYLDTESAQMV